MPVAVAEAAERSAYGRFPEHIERDWLGRWCHLSEADVSLARRRSGEVTRLGFAAQLVTVRAIGTFLADPSAVPAPIVASLARQLDIADPGVLVGYGKLAVRWKHTAEIRHRYGYTDFAAQPGHFSLLRWLYRQAWADDLGPTALFRAAHREMLADRVVLPGEQVLARVVGSVRERATRRLWSRLAAAASPEVTGALEALLVVPDGKRRSDLDRLRRPPFPDTVSTDTAGASEIVFALAWALGYRYGPRLADLADHRLWVIDARADYGPLQGLARNRANTSLIAGQWDQICRLAASLEARTVTPSAILRSLQRGPNPSSLGRARAELGRIVKTLHVLDYCHDPAYRRAIHRILGRGESRNSLARDTFHGGRGQLRQHYQAGQENQLGALGLMVNVIVLWQTVYIQAALDHLAAGGHKIDPADVARLSPLGHPTINLNGRYRTRSRAPSGGLRPLRRAG